MRKDTYTILIFRSASEYVWELHAPNGVVICRSCNSFKSPGLARESVSNWMNIIRERTVYIVEESIPSNAANKMGPVYS